jgi:phosphoglycolate phosphatase
MEDQRLAMGAYTRILFDLDGTLTDPMVGITRSVQYALSRFGLQAELEDLVPYIGPPLHESFQVFHSFDQKQAMQAVAYYREYYSERGIYENAVYPGITGMLQRLREQNRELAVATSKPTFFADQVLKHFKLDGFFALVAGSNLDGTRTDKTEVIRFALQQLSPCSPRRVVMVGDRKHDIIGARNCGIDSIAVAYGYGSTAELIQAAPTTLVHTVEELDQLLCSPEQT